MGVLVALALLGAACAGSDTTPTAASASAGGGDGLTSVVLPTVDGAQLDFGDLEGQDAILWFWAPW